MKVGQTQVNHRDYGEIVIEQFTYVQYQHNPTWCVPAWEERGYGNLAGPFASIAEAQAALDKELEYLTGSETSN